MCIVTGVAAGPLHLNKEHAVEFVTQVIVALALGLIVGGIATVILPGKNRIGFVMTVVVGAIAAFAGHYIAELFGLDSTEGIDWWKLAIQVGLAAIVIFVLSAVIHGGRR